MTKHSLSRVRKAKDTLVKRLSTETGFVGAGVSVGASGQYEITVLVADAASAVSVGAPDEWEGVPVRTQVGGVPKKH